MLFRINSISWRSLSPVYRNGLDCVHRRLKRIVSRFINYCALAEKLNMACEALRKGWRHLPHYYVGSSRNLKSARFDLDDALHYLKSRDKV